VSERGELLQIVLVGAAGLPVVDVNELVHCRWYITVLSGVFLDILPALKDGDSYGAALICGSLRRVRRSRGNCEGFSSEMDGCLDKFSTRDYSLPFNLIFLYSKANHSYLALSLGSRKNRYFAHDTIGCSFRRERRASNHPP
jgi:hypothetical protein